MLVLCCEWLCLFMTVLAPPKVLKELAFSNPVLPKNTGLFPTGESGQNKQKWGFCFQTHVLFGVFFLFFCYFVWFYCQIRILLCQWQFVGLTCRKHHQISQLVWLLPVASLVLAVGDVNSFCAQCQRSSACNRGKWGRLSLLCAVSPAVHHLHNSNSPLCWQWQCRPVKHVVVFKPGRLEYSFMCFTCCQPFHSMLFSSHHILFSHDGVWEFLLVPKNTQKNSKQEWLLAILLLI